VGLGQHSSRPSEDDAIKQMRDLKRLLERPIDKEEFQIIQQKLNMSTSI
jgi:hypothetical protein